MKQSTKMSRAVSQLEHIYNSLNADFFSGELPVPIVTVQSKPGTMGHCSVAKVWRRKEDKTHELNIAAEVLNYPVEETIDTMLHEMVHLFCRENGIKEVGGIPPPETIWWNTHLTKAGTKSCWAATHSPRP